MDLVDGFREDDAIAFFDLEERVRGPEEICTVRARVGDRIAEVHGGAIELHPAGEAERGAGGSHVGKQGFVADGRVPGAAPDVAVIGDLDAVEGAGGDGGKTFVPAAGVGVFKAGCICSGDVWMERRVQEFAVVAAGKRAMAADDD